MPIYEFECLKCHKKFELRRSIKDKDEDIKCPFCSAPHPKRQFSLFSAGATSSGGSSCASPGGFS